MYQQKRYFVCSNLWVSSCARNINCLCLYFSYWPDQGLNILFVCNIDSLLWFFPYLPYHGHFDFFSANISFAWKWEELVKTKILRTIILKLVSWRWWSKCCLKQVSAFLNFGHFNWLLPVVSIIEICIYISLTVVSLLLCI